MVSEECDVRSLMREWPPSYSGRSAAQWRASSTGESGARSAGGVRACRASSHRENKTGLIGGGARGLGLMGSARTKRGGIVRAPVAAHRREVAYHPAVLKGNARARLRRRRVLRRAAWRSADRKAAVDGEGEAVEHVRPVGTAVAQRDADRAEHGVRDVLSGEALGHREELGIDREPRRGDEVEVLVWRPAYFVRAAIPACGAEGGDEQEGVQTKASRTLCHSA